MQTSTQQSSPLERTLDLVVQLDLIESEVDTRLKRLQRTVKMQGFRPGKVPFKMVAQQYGGQIRQEVLGDTVQKRFSDAVREQNLRVAGYPRIEPKMSGTDEKKIEFSATFEVYPEVVLGDLAASSVERPAVSVGDAEVDKTLEVLRKQRVRYEATDRPAALDDQLEIDFKGTQNGEAFAGGEGRAFVIVLGSGRLLKDFETQLEGMKVGESKTFPLAFPEDYFSKDMAGKQVEFEVSVKRVAAPVLPEIDSEFARNLGVVDGDIVKMRQEIKENLEREVKSRVQMKLKEQVLDVLINTTPVELPRALLDMEIERMAEQMQRDLEMRGIAAKSMEMKPEMFAEQAAKRLKLGLILAQLVVAQGLKASHDQVRKKVDEHAQSYEKPEEVVSWYYSKQENLAEVESLVLEDNVVEWVLGRVKVNDCPMPLDDLMGVKQ